MRAYGVPWRVELELHSVVDWLTSRTSSKELVSGIYAKLIESTDRPLSLTYQWEKDLATKLTVRLCGLIV